MRICLTTLLLLSIVQTVAHGQTADEFGIMNLSVGDTVTDVRHWLQKNPGWTTNVPLPAGDSPQLTEVKLQTDSAALRKLGCVDIGDADQVCVPIIYISLSLYRGRVVLVGIFTAPSTDTVMLGRWGRALSILGTASMGRPIKQSSTSASELMHQTDIEAGMERRTVAEWGNSKRHGAVWMGGVYDRGQKARIYWYHYLIADMTIQEQNTNDLRKSRGNTSITKPTQP